MKALFSASVAALLLSALSPTVSAHAISIGFENAGPGSVNIWLGTYEHGGHHLEGSLQLEGVGGTVFGPTVVAYTMLTSTGIAFKPAGLIDGVTNFYPSTAFGVDGPLTGDPSIWEGFCPACGPVNHWQGVNFNGLSAGTYKFTYVPVAIPTAEWDLWNNNLNGTFDLSGVVVASPEPGTMAFLFSGVALIGLARKRKQ